MKKLVTLLLLVMSVISCNTVQPDLESMDILDIINYYRTTGVTCEDIYYPPVAPLVWDSELEEIALMHSVYMDTHSHHSHTWEDGTTLFDRFKLYPYDYITIGENIAAGYLTPLSVVEAWITSPIHCKNFMNSQFTNVAVSETNYYWCQLFSKK